MHAPYISARRVLAKLEIAFDYSRREFGESAVLVLSCINLGVGQTTLYYPAASSEREHIELQYCCGGGLDLRETGGR